MKKQQFFKDRKFQAKWMNKMLVDFFFQYLRNTLPPTALLPKTAS